MCYSQLGNKLARLSLTIEDKQDENEMLTLQSLANGGASLIPRVANTWAAPIAVNQSYRLDWGGSEFEMLSIEVFPLLPASTVTLELAISMTDQSVQVETADQSLQLAQQLPSSPEAAAAAFDVGNKTLSVVLVGTSSSQTQVCQRRAQDS